MLALAAEVAMRSGKTCKVAGRFVHGIATATVYFWPDTHFSLINNNW